MFGVSAFRGAGARAEDTAGDRETDELGLGSRTVRTVPAIAATPDPTMAKRVRYTNHPQELGRFLGRVDRIGAFGTDEFLLVDFREIPEDLLGCGEEEGRKRLDGARC
ncbi:hypothetical protein AM1_1803 [Acaryochloris marina MBIC11017]|uniref:Uncharacterized protein n=1 Tax=Acaryochloris marina (strain MBIC 11017) TaxID=329726 RepID=B0CCD9_ACAM1|nr:hypothetical protein AM1_1803 [Acaryochloris marina MBIC11017]